jgi:hypothetical protein
VTAPVDAGLLSGHTSSSRSFQYCRSASPPRTLIIPPEGGHKISAYGDTAQIKLSGKQTNGSMVVALGTSPPHRHLNEDDT